MTWTRWDARMLDRRRRARWLALLLLIGPHRKAAARRLAWTVRELSRLRDRAQDELADLNRLVSMEERACRGAGRQA